VSQFTLNLKENSDDMGDLKISPMLATIGYQVLPAGKRGLGGYARFGGGIASVKFTNGPAIRNIIGSTGVNVQCIVDGPIIFDMGAGIDYFLFPQLSITGDFRFLFANAGTKWRFSYGGVYTNSSSLGDKFYASTGQASIGVRFWLRKSGGASPAEAKP
jgi:hypothetical protein